MAEEKKQQSTEDLQREILQVELETKKLLLDEAKKRNLDLKESERRRHDANKTRMRELEEARRNHEATVRKCRHKSGGSPTNILKGGGVGSFSLLSRTILPDGVSVLLQCPRCRMLKYPPTLALKKSDPKAYVEELKEYKRLLEESQDNGLEHAEMRGPTFLFQNADGVPFIPERK